MTTAFISYTHADEALKRQFLQHLAPLRREALIEVWHDRMLRPGDHLDERIQRELASSDLIILLVSAAFLDSEYCFEAEMQRAFERQREGSAKVVTLILRPCHWMNVPVGGGQKLSTFLAVPKDGRPVTLWADADEAFTDAVGAIRRLLVERTTQVAAPASPSISREPVITSPIQSADSGVVATPSNEPLLPIRITDRDRHRFLRDAIEIAATIFEERLGNLSKQDSRIETDFERVDARNFVARVYADGKEVGSCRIFAGAEFFGDALCLSFSASSTNSMNEWLSLEAGKSGIFFKGHGMSGLPRDQNSMLNQAESGYYLWDVFLNHVKSRLRSAR